jgi:hypothetical protein
MPPDPQAARPTQARGLTVREVARYLRVGADRVRSWIRAGELHALNTAPAKCRRPRLVVLPHHLAEWERTRRAAAPAPKPPKPPKRQRRTKGIDFYPDD